MDVFNEDGKNQDFLAESLDFQVRPEYFVDRSCTGAWRLEESLLGWHDLTWVLSGRATYWMDDVRIELGAGDFVYIPEGSRRRAETDPTCPMHCLAFNFHVRNWSGTHIGLPLPNRFRLEGDGRLKELCAGFQIAWFEHEPGYRLESQAILLRILKEIILLRSQPRPARHVTERLTRIRAAMLDRYAEQLTVEELAAEEGLHPVYFGQMFKRHMGMSVREYLNRIRIRKAGELLASGGYTVAGAAERCGFPDPFHFSRVCRKLTGEVPSRFRA